MQEQLQTATLLNDTRGSKEIAQIIVFRLGQEEYGLSIEQIKEVVATPKVAAVPMSPDYIAGIANVRGNILAIVDLEKKFDLPHPGSDALPPYTLVVESWEHNMGLLVRQVPNTLSIPEADIDRSPQVIAERNYVEGIARVGEDRLIILIDIFKVISKQEL
ncbi:MAG: chemotaxis protein CheW [Bernardetiaceae bacterium]